MIWLKSACACLESVSLKPYHQTASSQLPTCTGVTCCCCIYGSSVGVGLTHLTRPCCWGYAHSCCSMAPFPKTSLPSSHIPHVIVPTGCATQRHRACMWVFHAAAPTCLCTTATHTCQQLVHTSEASILLAAPCVAHGLLMEPRHCPNAWFEGLRNPTPLPHNFAPSTPSLTWLAGTLALYLQTAIWWHPFPNLLHSRASPSSESETWSICSSNSPSSYALGCSLCPC